MRHVSSLVAVALFGLAFRATPAAALYRGDGYQHFVLTCEPLPASTGILCHADIFESVAYQEGVFTGTDVMGVAALTIELEMGPNPPGPSFGRPAPKPNPHGMWGGWMAIGPPGEHPLPATSSQGFGFVINLEQACAEGLDEFELLRAGLLPRAAAMAAQAGIPPPRVDSFFDITFEALKKAIEHFDSAPVQTILLGAPAKPPKSCR